MTIRNFTQGDITEAEKRFGTNAGALIAEWESKTYNGKFFEMFAVVDGENIVGTVSLYEHSESVVSLGVEIFEEYRRRGYALRACALALERARERRYRIVLDQVREDNKASIALHRRLGFENDGYIYITQKGSRVLLYIRAID